MQEQNNILLEKECQRIIENVPNNLTNDQKMRYLCHELALILSKSTEFFYEKENQERRREIYDNYKTIENFSVVCRNAVYKHVEQAEKLGLHCNMIEIKGDDNQEFAHWDIEYYGDNNKRYLINPIPDFYRIQMGFSTKSFCSMSEYVNYDGPSFDAMSKEYIRNMDKSLGYLEGDMYTEEFLKKLQTDIQLKTGTHIVRTTDVYQEYCLKLLELIKNRELTVDEKLEEMRKIDPKLDEHKGAIKDSFEKEIITKGARKVMHNLSIKSLLNEEGDLNLSRDGAQYVGNLDVTKISKLKEEVLIYKFNYLLECMPQITSRITGFIENKNFMDEIKKYIFKKGGERDSVHRHTVSRIENGKKEYYMMFSLKVSEDDNSKIYAFYNQKTKECIRNIEPLEFMIENNLTPLKDSSLNDEINHSKNLNQMFCEEVVPTEELISTK